MIVIDVYLFLPLLARFASVAYDFVWLFSYPFDFVWLHFKCFTMFDLVSLAKISSPRNSAQGHHQKNFCFKMYSHEECHQDESRRKVRAEKSSSGKSRTFFLSNFFPLNCFEFIQRWQTTHFKAYSKWWRMEIWNSMTLIR